MVVVVVVVVVVALHREILKWRHVTGRESGSRNTMDILRG